MKGIILPVGAPVRLPCCEMCRTASLWLTPLRLAFPEKAVGQLGMVRIRGSRLKHEVSEFVELLVQI